MSAAGSISSTAAARIRHLAARYDWDVIADESDQLRGFIACRQNGVVLSFDLTSGGIRCTGSAITTSRGGYQRVPLTEAEGAFRGRGGQA